jgi:hypothetical protein
MGIEVQRSSTPKVCREKLKESIKIILTGNEESLIDYIDTFKEEFLSMSPEEISCPRSVKGMKKYADKNTVFSKGTPIAVKGALMYNTLLSDLGLHETYPTIGEGDKIKFLYLKKENPVRINVISFSSKLPPEFNLLSYIDYHLQFEKTFLDPLKHITECVGWKFERVNNLSGFFG